MHAGRVLMRISQALRTKPHFWVGCVTTIWLGAAAAGLGVLWRYDNMPGESASAPQRWPAATSLARATDRPTIVMLAHPHCTCTQASLGELAEAIAQAEVTPKTYVLFMAPSKFESGWENTELWRLAAALPGADVVRDDDGREARQFGAATSGQTLLYGADGVLAFSGGVTGARAHAGDNAGRQSLVALLNHQSARRSATSVFGCPLFNTGS